MIADYKNWLPNGMICANSQFSYDGKQQLSRQIVEGTAEYITLPEDGVGLDVGCGSGALTIACAKRNFPDVIRIREELLPKKDRQICIACDLRDHSWMDNIPAEDGAVFFAFGVFYYIKTADVKNMFCALAKRFPGGKIDFDATTANGLKNMLKTWLKDADMQTVGLYFSVEDEKHLAAWSDDFSSVIRKGYMTGYRKLDQRYGFVANALFRTADRSRMCQIGVYAAHCIRFLQKR